VTVEISGHTDNTGDYASNLEMSQNRADAVRDYLISGGVDASRLTAVGYGDRNPVDSNETEEGRQNNRRTDLKILSK
jgi:outer membrane protein OmpA-like peptidoglycan-associated protein